MRIYIAGPMTGLPELNFSAFNAMAEKLSLLGHTPLNPTCYPKGLEQKHYMDISMAMLRSSEGVIMLQGWQNSVGARAEKAYAEAIGIEIFYANAVNVEDL